VRIYLDCYPCFVRQAIEAARLTGADEAGQLAVLHCVLEALQHVEPGSTPPEMGGHIHRLIRAQTGNSDPYREVKARNTEEALAVYPRLKQLVSKATDPFDRALRLAIAGNIIDCGVSGEYDLWTSIERVLGQRWGIDDSGPLKEALKSAPLALYLADNAGETVFDRLLIEQLHPVPVTYAVKSGPVLNDATRQDALAAGLDRVAHVVSTGCDEPGTILERCSQEFRRLYDKAEVIIAKGQGNYETLSTGGKRLFFLLQVKCPVIARDIGVPTGSIVVKRG